MTSAAARARLGAELRLEEGVVAAALDDPALVAPTFQIARDAFLLRLPMGLSFHYRRGSGTLYQRPPGVSDDEVALFFDGSVYGAIAWLNGLVPLHAASVVAGGGVHAFTGPSGEGKSTLVTALSQRGLALCSDDVLLLDLGDPTRVMALAGHRRVKLWADALALTGRSSTHAVRPGLDKYYVAAGDFWDGAALPIRQLTLLRSIASEAHGVTAIEGAQRLVAVRSAYYRPQFERAVVAQAVQFRAASRLGQAIGLARFNRSRDPAAFASGVDLIEAHVRAAAA